MPPCSATGKHERPISGACRGVHNRFAPPFVLDSFDAIKNITQFEGLGHKVKGTLKDLKHEVEIGAFREDLYFRLNVVSVALPLLSERREDIPLLIRFFIEKYSLAFHKKVTGMQPQALDILRNYSYPGNVRELENIIERAVALTDGEEIASRDLPKDLQDLEFDTLEGDGLPTLEEKERRYIAKVLASTNYNKGMTAQILDIPRTTLWRKIKLYGLE